MSSPIKRIEVKSFRGASRTTTIDLDPAKKLVVMFGENGTGKTTIVDALDAVANGKVGSLESRSSTDQRQHTHSIGTKPESVLVTLTAAAVGSTWKATVKAGKFTVVPSSPKPRVSVLRKGRIDKLIAAEPKDRYAELAQFINVKKVEKSEAALLEACKDIQRQHEQAFKNVSAAKNGLEEAWLAEGKPGKTAMDWAKGAIALPPTKVQADLTLMDSVADELEASIKASGEEASAQAAYTQAAKDHETAETAVKAEETGARASELVDLLTRAKKYLAAPNDDTDCPVCENKIDINDLRKTLDTRLTKFSKLTLLMAERAKAERKRDAEKTKASSAATTCIDTCSRLVAAANACADYKVITKTIDWTAFADVADKKADAEHRLKLAKKLIALAEESKPTVSAKLEALQKVVHQFTVINGLVKQHDDNEAKAKELEDVRTDLLKVKDLVQAKRKAFAQKTLNEISDECGRLYAKIHPGENITNVKLLLDESKRASIDQTTDFEGHKGVPPQAYLSDSHLDTLGFCVWLAMAKKDSPASTILALDDIFTSADASHLTRIVQLLADECPHFCQTIVTTHFRQWRDRYRMQSGPGISAQLLELHRWSLNKGIGLSTTKLAVDDLSDELKKAPLPRQEVSSQAGIMLEGLLDRLAEVYELRLPFRRSGQYTLGELLNGSNRLFKALAVSKDGGAGFALETPVQPQYDAVNALNFIRNQVGAHFNLAGADIADSDVESFGKATVDLAKAVTCSECGQVPDRKEVDYIRCSCKKCRLTPTEAPKK